jgi:alkyl hydroperoxide reductase subunit AhpF
MCKGQSFTRIVKFIAAEGRGLAVKNSKGGEIIRLYLNRLFMGIDLFPNTDLFICLVEASEVVEIAGDNQGSTL